ncbi:MAG: hypothetical protein HY235_24280 [Acidobacteria bacterium]|nr:hypothetical protein [Acidobacteriota bacterium]
MRIFTQAKHISEEALGLHALDDLPQSRRATVNAHLSGCTHCQSEFHDIQEFVTVLRKAARANSAARIVLQ